MHLRLFFFFFTSRRRHTRCSRDWSSDVCSSDLRTPVPILFGLLMPAIVSAIAKEPWLVTLGYAGLLLIIVIKRLIAQPSTEKRQISLGYLLLNRLLFDRDVRHRADWVHRKHVEKK